MARTPSPARETRALPRERADYSGSIRAAALDFEHGVFFVRARPIDGLRSGRHRSLLGKMPKPKPRKTLRPRGGTRVKGFASRGRWKKWILILLVVLLLIPATQVAVVRFIHPPWTLPMLIEQVGATFSKAPKSPLRYRWIALPQIPEMFLEHLWISEDQRFFQHEGFDWKEMDLAVKEAERKGKPVRS